jgi:hypothetical protein
MERPVADWQVGNLREVGQLRAFVEFLHSGADWQDLKAGDSDTYKLFSEMGKAFLERQKSDPEERRSVVGMAEAAITKLERRIDGVENDPRIMDYENATRRVRALLNFYRAREDWNTVQAADHDRFEELRATYSKIEKARTTDPAYRDTDIDFMATAQALLERFSGKALNLAEARVASLQLPELPLEREAEIKVDLPREQFTKAELLVPGEPGVDKWQILRVKPRARTYVIGRADDRRPITDIIADVVSERSMSGKRVGYEISWEDFERAALASGRKVEAVA